MVLCCVVLCVFGVMCSVAYGVMLLCYLLACWLVGLLFMFILFNMT